jgi:HAE1 family hydrophobic/amphiphilic exporter-1
VEASHKEREIITRTDGGESVQIEIYKEADTNSVALARRVKEAVGESDLDLIIASAAAPVTFGDDDGGDDEGPRAAPGLATTLYKEEGALLQIVADRSVFIQSSIREVFLTAAIGGLLAVLVLFLFLKNVRTTVIIGVSIPISLLIVFAPLNLLGVTLNIMSLGGLALGIGMLVDSSIVVLESIHRCREEGDDVSSAAVRGTGEVRGAVLASTLTSIAVFFPMVFVEGVAGQAFGDLGLAVVVSLLAAAAVALFFIPMLASRGGGAKKEPATKLDPRALKRFAAWEVYRPALRRPLAWFRAAARPASTDAAAWRRRLRNLLKPFRYAVVALWAGVAWLYFTIRFVLGTIFEWVIGKPLLLVFSAVAWVVAKVLWPALGLMLRPLFWLPVKLTDWAMKGLSGVYPALLRRALANPLVIVLVVGACFWGTWKVVTALDSELLPEVHQGEFTVEVELPVGTPLEETDLVLSPIEEAILAEREHIRALIVTLGFDSANSQRSDEGEHTARFKIVLEETRDPAGLEQQVVSRLRERFEGVPDLHARIVRPVLFSSRTPIEVEVHGDELHRLKLYADRASEVMATLPGLTDVQATLQSGAPEVQIVYDRDRLARYGMNVGEVARLVRDKVQGFEATRLNLKDRRIPIMVRLAADDRETVADVEGVIVNPGQDPALPLASVAEVTLGEGPSEVRRVDGRRVALIRANIGEGSLGSATASIENALRSRIDWPSDMTFLITGQQEEWESSKSSLWFALGLSIFLVYVIMAAQFESLIHPLVIMVSIPLAFIGTVVALMLLGISLSVVVFLGMIMLAGIGVNNAIVLVDYINRLRRRGIPEAIITAGSVRLRPILMTTATTVLGLLPMALGLGDGAELRTPMAIAVISGLISSTALTLIVIPSLYAIADTMIAKLLGKRVQETRETGETTTLETLHGAGRGAVTP